MAKSDPDGGSASPIAEPRWRSSVVRRLQGWRCRSRWKKRGRPRPPLPRSILSDLALAECESLYDTAALTSKQPCCALGKVPRVLLRATAPALIRPRRPSLVERGGYLNFSRFFATFGQRSIKRMEGLRRGMLKRLGESGVDAADGAWGESRTLECFGALRKCFRAALGYGEDLLQQILRITLYYLAGHGRVTRCACHTKYHAIFVLFHSSISTFRELHLAVATLV